MMRKFYFIIFAVVCLLSCINPAMAYTITNPYDSTTYNAGYTDSVTINFNLYQGYILAGYYIDGNENNEFVRINSGTYSGTFTLNPNSNSQNFYFIVISQQTGRENIRFTVTYTYQEPQPPAPEGPYLTATVLSESTTGTMYEIKPMPDDNSYSFSYITVGNTPTNNGIGSPYHNPAYNSEQVAIRYKVPAGESTTFYCYALSSEFTFDLQLISITATGTSLNDEEIINQTSPEIQPNNTAYNPPPIPTARPGTSDNPINSGKFKPSSSNFITPFTQFTENARELTRLPEMANPTELRQTIANTSAGNITAPLYDSIEGFSNMLIFPAVTISQNIQFILQPIEEMLLYCDDVLKEVFKTVNTFFNTIYPLRDFFYMLIPDFVWWIMATLLIFEIVVTLMTFIYGRSVTFYYLFGLGEDKK